MKKGKRLIEVFAALLLIILGLAVYLALSMKQENGTSSVYDYRNKDLYEAFNAYRMEQYDRAEMLFLKAQDTTRKKKIKSVAHLYIGNIYFKMGNFVMAEDFFQKSLSFDNRNIHALYNTALAALNRGDERKALKYSQRAFEIDAKFIPNLILLGNVHYVTGRYDKGLEYLGRIADSPDSQGSLTSKDSFDLLAYAILRYNAACIYLKAGESTRARALFLELLDLEEVPESVKGLCSVKLSEITQDPDYLRSAIDTFPSSPVLRYNLALDLYINALYAEAVTLLRTIPDRSQKDRSVVDQLTIGRVEDQKVATLYGRSLFMSGYYQEALEFYSSLYNEEGSAEIAQIIGDTYVKLSDTERAREYYGRALDNYRNELVFLNLFLLFLDEGDYGMAHKLCTDSLAINRKNPLPYMCKAELAFREEDTPSARKSLEKALQHSGSNIQDLMKIAAIYRQNGMPMNAVQIYHRVLALEPAYEPARAGLVEVYFHSGHEEKVKSIIEGINGSSLQRDHFYRISLLRAQVESEERALQIYGSLIGEFPSRYEAYWNLALLRIQRGEYNLAVQTVQQCLDRIGKLERSILSGLHSILGIAHLLSEKEEDAIDALVRARELDDSNEIPIHYLRMIATSRSTGEPPR